MIEVPTLNWIGKDKVVNHANDVPFHVLERKYSFDAQGKHEGDNGSQNKIIHGDNLLILKSLLPEYEGKVKCIYIDPPYNTGNENWIYNDNVNDPKIKKWLGEVVGKEGEDLSRHDKWLCMMYPRLKLLRRLLADDGAIFISIDDNEQANLKLICNEIFGATNYQATITYVRKTSGKQDSTNFVKSTEYILTYSKSDLWRCNELLAEEKVISRYNKIDRYGRKYRETDLRKTGTGDRREDRPLMYYPFYYDPKTKDLTLENKSGYVEIFPIKPDGTAGRWRWGYETSLQNIDHLTAKIMPKYKSEKKYTIYELDYMDKRGESVTVKEHTHWDKKEFNSDNAVQEFKNLGFSNQAFTFPKSSALIRHIIYLSTDKNSIVLDSFAGSGTTAHAVLKLNKEDGGNRNFILVEMEDYAERITAERVKRVIQGYGDIEEGTGGDFNFYEIGEPLLVDDDLNESVPLERIRAYVWYTETKTPYIEPSGASTAFLGTYKDTAYYFHYEKDSRTSLDFEFLQTISEKTANYVIYADECALGDDFLASHYITFKKIPRDISKL